MKARIAPGTRVDYKPRPGLGGWFPGELVEWRDGERNALVRDRRGEETVVGARYVRARAGAVDLEVTPKPKARRVSKVRTHRVAGAASRPVPKPDGPLRDPRFLAWVRLRPCCICGAPGPSEAHHYGPRGAGQKTDDVRTVPLCRLHHDEWHQRGALPSAALSGPSARVRFLVTMVDQFVAWRRQELA